MTPGNAADCEPSVTQLEGTRVGASSSPTVRRRRLGMELRRLREEANKQIEDVAELLECSPSKVSRMETGRVPIRARDVRDLLNFYGVPEEEHGPLLELARGSREKGWWHQYKDALRPQFEVYIGLEIEASVISIFDTQIVPGLFQTEEYARAMFRLSNVPLEEADARIAVRLARQDLLNKADAARIWVILDEAILRRQVGGIEVMRNQLERLLKVIETSDVTLQILPFSVGAHPGMAGAFTILEFFDPTDPKVVYLDAMTSDLYLEKRQDANQYSMAFDHLRAAALSPDDSKAMIKMVAAEFENR